jgi:uncharacterized membrane protein
MTASDALGPALTVALLWVVFGGTHVGLATARVRAALVARLGDAGFLALFSGVAAVSFSVLASYYATHRFAGAPGLALGRSTGVRLGLMAVVVTGVTLTFLLDYARSPTALFDQPIHAPHGIERVTRHPFFAGVALLALAHVLLAAHLVGTVFFAGLAALASAGAWHQDRKLLGRRGGPYGGYLAATSALPFAAILAGRQRLVWREIPPRGLLLGLAAAAALRAVHASIFAHGGAWVIGVLLAGAAISTRRAWLRAQRLAATPPGVPAAS